ncbi:hypothetical protein DH2020_008079 [Rehmannia glutinosa]|uniref:Jacalin-type lectin domain-containing protein n=1 Tax=Rehmannia glutinosa TaxID=99300 RepID=A0ABR0U101_REHGL
MLVYILQEKHERCEGEISVGAWGGSSGNNWSYKAKHGIKQIIIKYGDIIDSIMFKGDTDDASPADYSSKFGGDGGGRTDKIDIDFPSEFVTGISVTHGRWGNFPDLVTSVKFHTNRSQYGPFGKGSGDPFTFNAEGGVVTGFHGRAGRYLDAIGVYIKPACSLFKVVQMKQHSEITLRGSGLLPRSPGPWGCVNGGREWDDGVFSAVKAVHVHVSGSGVISAVRFEYEKRDGTVFLSPKHGGSGGVVDFVHKVEIDGNSEFLIGVEGFYGPVEGVDVIRSVTFHTNKGKYGPMGNEIGMYFNSMSSVASHGKVVGFHGRSGAYLNAIGLHTEYL